MNVNRTIELWKESYKKDAYIDQTGKPQWGHVVSEIVTVDIIGGISWTCPYTGKVEKEARKVAVERATGKIFYANPIIDYFGHPTWRHGKDFYREKPYNTKGYVNPEGEPIQDL